LVRRNWLRGFPPVFALCAATAIMAPAQTFTSLFSFDGTNGQWPIYSGSLVQGLNGELYGTTFEGGKYKCGTVFEVTRGGTLTTLHNFYNPDGCSPYTGLVLGTNGNFYGTANGGGANISGTVFEITAAGAFTTLYNFCMQTNCSDGANPAGPLMQAANGYFYGTTERGGANGDGTIFRMTPGGALTTLYSFCNLANCADGQGPVAGLVQGADGNLYGTTSGNYGQSPGTVFKMTPAGVLTTLYTFCSQTGCTDGEQPSGGLAAGPESTFYGTTYHGGAGFGTIFKITEGGTFTNLYTFCDPACSTGGTPQAAFVRATDGNFYGTAYEGGVGAYEGGTAGGTVFQLTPEGTLSDLYNFCSQASCSDGKNPAAGVIQDTDGSFYGTTYEGGTSNNGADGTVFRLSMGLAPFVKLLPSGGAVGATIDILGSNLTGATSVTFNGTAATFTVVSASLITATVPTGATTGTVKVVTPSRTLKSNTSFTVH